MTSILENNVTPKLYGQLLIYKSWSRSIMLGPRIPPLPLHGYSLGHTSASNPIYETNPYKIMSKYFSPSSIGIFIADSKKIHNWSAWWNLQRQDTHTNDVIGFINVIPSSRLCAGVIGNTCCRNRRWLITENMAYT